MGVESEQQEEDNDDKQNSLSYPHTSMMPGIYHPCVISKAQIDFISDCE